MFKENTFYRATQAIDNRARFGGFYLKLNDVVLVSKCVENTDFSYKRGTRFIVDLVFDCKSYKHVQWDKSFDYLLEEII